jgi:hypothetical protein
MFRKRVRIIFFAILITAIYFLLVVPKGRKTTERSYPTERGRRESPYQPRPQERGSERNRAERGAGDSQTGVAGEVECASEYFANWQQPTADSCQVRMNAGFPMPDPRCTPGGVNPTVSIDVLRDRQWRTRSVRNCASSEAQKHAEYLWYDIEKPRINSNQDQVCELDHLVPLELGGADGLGNIWPECGPDAVTLNERYFKQKDHVENYLAEEVKAGRMPLREAQRGIAANWAQYRADAERWCAARGRC